jgi:hypothetical protein
MNLNYAVKYPIVNKDFGIINYHKTITTSQFWERRADGTRINITDKMRSSYERNRVKYFTEEKYEKFIKDEMKAYENWCKNERTKAYENNKKD